MGKRLKIAAGTMAALMIAGGSSIAIGQAASERHISGDVADLFAVSADPDQTVVTEADLVGLPEPVQRWLRWSDVVGKPIPTSVRLRQTGTFRLGEGKKWMPFTAEEYYTTNPPGFVWSTSMEMFPLVSITGRDRYTAGTGDINMRVLGLISVSHKSGGALNQGALLRYLNEMMWFPAAALRPYISWTQIDSTSAKATMTAGDITGDAIFFFDEAGRITNMTADRENDAKGKRLPWSTPITAYGEFGEIRIPTEGTAIWQYETSEFPYVRLRVTEIEYDNPAGY